MKSKLYIKYKPEQSDTGLDLTTIGESFIGLDSNIKEFFAISGIDGDLVVSTEKIREGSIIVDLGINIITSLPFHNVKEFTDFLYFVGAAEYKIATDFFSAFGNGYKTVNDFLDENPLIHDALNVYIGYYFGKMMAAADSQKKQPNDMSGSIPIRYAKRLHQMIKEGKFKKTLKPISEGYVDQIAISSTDDFAQESIVTSTNVGNYLPDEEKILPELENGSTHNFIGELLAIQSTKGEVLKFKIYNIDKRYELLTVYPLEGTKTEDYVRYYKKKMNVKAEILRKSLFRKPELKILSIEPMQGDMFE